MNSKSSVAAIVGRLKPKAPSRRREFTMAVTEIAHALNIEDEPAAMMLYGLCATGNVRWFDAQGELIDEDECTIADFNQGFDCRRP